MKQSPQEPEKSSVTAKYPGLGAENSETKPSRRTITSASKEVKEHDLGPPPTKESKRPKKPQRPENQKTKTGTVLQFPGENALDRAKKNKILKWSGFGILAVAVVVGLIIYFSPLLAIHTIQVSGTQLVTQTRAEELLEPLHNRPLPRTGERQVMELLGQEPAVESVSIRAEPPETLIVEVTEHTPVAMSQTQDGYIVFSESAEELATISAQRAQEYDLPVVASSEDVADPLLFNTITEVLGQVPEDLRDQVTQATGNSIDSITLTLNNGRTVTWGSTDEGELKAQVLTALLNMSDEQAAGIQEYDVSTPTQPVTR